MPMNAMLQYRFTPYDPMFGGLTVICVTRSAIDLVRNPWDIGPYNKSPVNTTLRRRRDEEVSSL